jgi:hypothetical protein
MSLPEGIAKILRVTPPAAMAVGLKSFKIS